MAGQRAYAVGEVQETYIDTSRPTQASPPNPARPSRTLVTTILYPAAGSASSGTPQAGATPDRSGAPYPLIMFSHGLGGSPEIYQPLLQQLAAAGFVVAAPLFPLTNANTPGGTVAGDVINQPADISFVLTQVLQASNGKGLLTGLVGPTRVSVAGHSNGAITTLGLAANTCCRETRARAAVIMAGTTEAFPGGQYDFAKAPPLLIVHGTDDALIPYEQGVAVFNSAQGPKGLLTVTNGDHGAAAALDGPSAAVVVRTVLDFLNATLRDDTAAGAQMLRDGQSALTSLHYVAQPGSTETIPTVPAPTLHLKASVTPSTGLAGGQHVMVMWSGYTAGKVVNILECAGSNENLGDSAACNYTKAALLHPDPTGSGSVQLEIVEGPVGSGTCDATHQGCFIVVNNASSPDPASSVKLPIAFGS